tara:strand:+ start:241 stop:447 length:207 start_codon:yes stop_codon:yes gene_type:complete
VLEVGDLVLYIPYNSEPSGSWVMYGGLGIIISILHEADIQKKSVYKVKWIDSFEDSLLPGDFLEKMEF